jgi:hypothetical protein
MAVIQPDTHVPDDPSAPVPAPAPPLLGVESTPEQQRARGWITPLVVGGYLALVLVNVGIPMAFVGANVRNLETIDIQNLSTAVTTALSGLVGILGFVVGYYFKSVRDSDSVTNGVG